MFSETWVKLVCVRELDSVHDLHEDLTSVSRKEANGNIGIRSHVCVFLFIKLHFHVTRTIIEHEPQLLSSPKASLHFLCCTL